MVDGGWVGRADLYFGQSLEMLWQEGWWVGCFTGKEEAVPHTWRKDVLRGRERLTAQQVMSSVVTVHKWFLIG